MRKLLIREIPVEILQAELKVRGYSSRKIPKHTVKKTFEIDPDLLKDFMKQVRKQKIKVKDAVNIALQKWLHKK